MTAESQKLPARIQPWLIVAAGILLVAAVAVRWLAAGGDLWLDEIWSWIIAHESKSLADVVTKYPSDNNHLLNTFLIFWLGDQSNLRFYRLPAVVFGVATVALAGWIVRRRGPCAVVAALAIFGGSYLQVLYSSEARGYAPLVFFSLLAFAALDEFLARRGWVATVLFWLSCLLGGLSHLAFLQTYAALLIWSVIGLFERRNLPHTLLDLARLHLVPLAFLVGLYFIFIHNLDVGGGNEFTILGTVLSACSLALGGPEAGPISYAVAGLALISWIVLIIAEWKQNRARATFFAIAIVVVPTLLLTLKRPDVLFVRYFLVSITFFLLLTAEQLGRFASRNRNSAIAALSLIILFGAANGLQVSRLIRLGRGHYSEAVAYMLAHSNRPKVSVAGDHDYRNGMVLAFYTQKLPPGRELNYLNADQVPPNGPEWFLVHEQTLDAVPRPTIQVRGREFQLAREFPFAGLSGWRWFVYHNPAFGPLSP